MVKFAISEGCVTGVQRRDFDAQARPGHFGRDCCLRRSGMIGSCMTIRDKEWGVDEKYTTDSNAGAVVGGESRVTKYLF